LAGGVTFELWEPFSSADSIGLLEHIGSGLHGSQSRGQGLFQAPGILDDFGCDIDCSTYADVSVLINLNFAFVRQWSEIA
jgi:hypothetical protein